MAAVCALDIGTTRIKALLLTAEATPGPVAAEPSALVTPSPGRQEVDAETLWERTMAVLQAVAAGGPEVEALAISNQRATVFLVDGDGHPFGPGLSWQDRRGAGALSSWLAQVGPDRFRAVTGLVPSTLWSAAKILWWRSQGLPAGARIATVQDWALRRLGGRDWLLDHANASLTGLMDVRSLAWDADLVRAAGLTEGQLPILAPSGTCAGALSADVARTTGLPAGTPLILGGGDQQCAALGAGALAPGIVSVSLGTAGVVGVATDRVVIDPAGRLVSLAHVAPGRWVLEGLENAYGGAHEWGRELLGGDLAPLAAQASAGARGLTFLPYLAGTGAPDYDWRARGVFVGLTLAHGRADIARAILEGTTVELVRILAAARELVPTGRLVASGGAARCKLLLDMLAGFADAPISVAAHPETGLIGAGLLAWSGVGRWRDVAVAGASLPPAVEAAAPDPAQRQAYHALFERYLAVLAGLRRGELLAPAEEGTGG